VPQFWLSFCRDSQQVGHHRRRLATAHRSVTGPYSWIQWCLTTRIEQSLAQEVAIPLRLRVPLRQSIHVSLQCSESLLPSRFDFWNLDLVTVMTSGVPVIGIHETGKGNAAGETIAVELSTARFGGLAKAGFLMDCQVLMEMSIDMLVDCAAAKVRRMSLVSKQPLLVWRTFFALTEQSSMVGRNEHR
jgi:hypothetical protein